MGIYDGHGVAIAPTDIVVVTSWDCSIRRAITKLGRTRVTIEDADGYPRAIAGFNLSVVSRDGVDPRRPARGRHTNQRQTGRRLAATGRPIRRARICLTGRSN
jgi:hypothetical protein